MRLCCLECLFRFPSMLALSSMALTVLMQGDLVDSGASVVVVVKLVIAAD
jgi:hypothetical protein